MFIGDVTLNQMKVLTKGDQLFYFEDAKNIELYSFRAGPMMLRTIIKKPKNIGELESLRSHLPENKVLLLSRVIIGEEKKSPGISPTASPASSPISTREDGPISIDRESLRFGNG